jgi:hypothetical protein
MKKHFLLLSFLLWTSATFAQQSKVVAVNYSEQALNKGIVALKPADIFRKPELALQVWIDKPVPLSMYNDKEKKFQEYLNEKAENIIKTYSPIGDEAFFSNDNLKVSIDQRNIDNEPITPYTWKWLDLEKEENGEKVVAKLRRPNWWILANKADKVGNVVYLELAEQGITGGFTVKKIRVSQIDTRLMKFKREGDYTYRPLTGWFQHETSNVWDYTFNNGETIGATPNHPFFSERRKDYIPIGEIEIGEPIRNPQNEIITLASKEKRTSGIEKVYNLEIYRDHNFMVGKSSLLVHNSCFTLLADIQNAILTKDLKKALINGKDLIPDTWQSFSINKGMFYHAPGDKTTYLRIFTKGENPNYTWNLGKPYMRISKKINGIEEFFDIDGNLVPRITNPTAAQLKEYFEKTHILIDEIIIP